jgi:hypothetical protein
LVRAAAVRELVPLPANIARPRSKVAPLLLVSWSLVCSVVLVVTAITTVKPAVVVSDRVSFLARNHL